MRNLIPHIEKCCKYAALTSGRYCDAGRSGKDIKGRPEFQRMLDDITAQKDDITKCIRSIKLMFPMEYVSYKEKSLLPQEETLETVCLLTHE